MRAQPSKFDAEPIGFSAVLIGPPEVPHPLMVRAHTHMDIEVNLVLSGWIRYFVPNGIRTLRPGTPAVFWAGIPHRIVESADGSEFVTVAVPLDMFLEWQLPGPLIAELLEGAFIERVPSDDDEASVDRGLFRRWTHDVPLEADRFPEGEPPLVRSAAGHEIRAWFERFAAATAVPSGNGRSSPPSGGSQIVDQVSRHICEHYADKLSVPSLAEVARVHPNYLMQVFRQTCGLRLWDYVLQVRIGHAQRLLATSSMKIIEASLESGFTSLTQFNALFKRMTGMTPTQYRKRHG